MPPDNAHRSWQLTEKREPTWFRWRLIGGICLGIALAVVGFLKVTYP